MRTAVRIVALLLVTALAAALSPIASSTAAPANRSGDDDGTMVFVPNPDSNAASSRAREKRYERKVRVYTNRARKRHDLKRVRRTKCVDRFANRWARKMARRQSLQHQNLRRVMRRCNLSMAGENIAYGYRSGKAVVRGWMHSPGHRANILKGRYRLLGVGMKRDKFGRPWVSQVFGRH